MMTGQKDQQKTGFGHNPDVSDGLLLTTVSCGDSLADQHIPRH